MTLRPLLVVALAALLAAACGGGREGSGADAGVDVSTDAAPRDSAPADTPAQADAPLEDILVRLRAVPGLTVAEQTSQVPGYRLFAMEYEQPVDHDDPGGQSFGQRLVLLHRSAGAPAVLTSTGYALWEGYTGTALDEPAQILSANELTVEHRYFAPSRPDPTDWSLLTIQQAAADHHRVIEALRPIYTGRWVSSGASKGGMTSVFHRRFYPDDVAGTVAYVAPLSFGTADPRYLGFLEQVGHDAACRDALKTFQRLALEARAEIDALMQSSGMSFTFLGREQALEHAVLLLPFAFWQYLDASVCPYVPAAGATASELYYFLEGQAGMLTGVSDDSCAFFMPYYYQAATQLGEAALAEGHLADLLLHPGSYGPAAYISPEIPVTFDPAVMVDVDTWVRTSGSQLLLVYGENDPWSAGAFELGDAVDSYRYYVAGGNHGSGILDLAPAERDAATAALRRWAGLAPQGAPQTWRSRREVLGPWLRWVR
jgi:hypothetical protein